MYTYALGEHRRVNDYVGEVEKASLWEKIAPGMLYRGPSLSQACAKPFVYTSAFHCHSQDCLLVKSTRFENPTNLDFLDKFFSSFLEFTSCIT